MLELYVIRHGLAGKSVKDAVKDEKRALTKKGKDKMKKIAKALDKCGIKFDVVISSPLVRAEETAEIINAHCSGSKKHVVTDYLKPDASKQKLIKFLNQIKKHKSVAIVGHEPFLSEFASFCLSKNDHSFITLKKGGVLKLEIETLLKPGQCTLSWLLEPDHLTN